MTGSKPLVVREGPMWVVKVVRPNGGFQDFRCASEKQARHLLEVFCPRQTDAPRSAA